MQTISLDRLRDSTFPEASVKPLTLEETVRSIHKRAGIPFPFFGELSLPPGRTFGGCPASTILSPQRLLEFPTDITDSFSPFRA